MKVLSLLVALSLLSIAFAEVAGIARITGVGAYAVNGSVTISDSGLDAVNFNIDICGLSANQNYYLRVLEVGDILSVSSPVVFNPNNANLDCTGGSSPAGSLGSQLTGSTGCISATMLGNGLSLHANQTNSIIGRLFVFQQYGACGAYNEYVYAKGVIGYRENSTYSYGGTINAPVGATVLLKSIANDGTAGSAILTPLANNAGTRVTIYVIGLTPFSTHGIHIHTYGDVSTSTTTGGHFNPFGVSHGCPNNDTRHAGDLGNFVADSAGTIYASIDVVGFLNSSAQDSFVGRALVVHGGTDDCVTAPAGNSGARILHGVIGISKEVSFPSGISVIVPKNGTSTSGTVTFNWVHNGNSWGVNAKVELSNLVPNAINSFQIHEYGDVEDLGNGLLLPPPVRKRDCVIGTGGSLKVDSKGKVLTNIFSYSLSFKPNNGLFIMGRGIAIREINTGCGDGSYLGAGVIGYQLNSITLATGSATANPNAQAVCRFKGTVGYENVKGTIFFTVNSTAGVNVYISVTGLPASVTRSLHIHAYGDLTHVNGTNLGGHFNPTAKNHGCPNSDRHVGDMGNFNTTAKGGLYYLHVNPNAELNPSSISYILGRGIVLHGGTDDCVSNPAGNSGPRVAQCVIGSTKPEVRNTPVEPTNPPTSAPTNAPTSAPTPTPTHSSSSMLTPFFVVIISAILLSFF